MRRFVLVFSLCAIALPTPEAAANGTIVATVTTGPRYEWRPVQPQGAGLLSRLRGNVQAASPTLYQAELVTERQKVIVADPTRPCTVGVPNPVPTVFGTVLLGVAPSQCVSCAPSGHCFPSCFISTPCTCCKHRARYALPWSKWAKHAQAVTTNGIEGQDYVRITDPGFLAPLFHKTQFQQAP
jgi:hypothetical protein